MDSNFIPSLIRTWVPIVVGALVSWLVTLGVDVSGEAVAGFVLFVTVVLQGAYYAVVRWLEKRFPKLGWLLGSLKQPQYK